ncbi:MAG: hypothetical protein COT24_02260 [Candidatus Kerfeldbacteria bacterium CG08_land_8_20_14_0_20_40_16]|uniref:Phospholipase C/D domain-containing protein n=1 Tax=Candidatus Kerfeldbacteria bacterium CG08_land_8_20_14_0_20_40_16 TaxID=2014244 RepID=A0A2H0YW67_9BACT|nr:MAG: hypothetical protein COT24_02260 [Candidatus Kerfeldbacteria bacterium CG08_land_8_20_14_0_20_40_16]
MYSGKYLGKFLPFFAWGTHWFINKEALSLLEKEGVKIGTDFPPLRLINIFEEFRGPDGAWIRGEYPDSNMSYNPDTGEGNAPREAVRLLGKLILALEEKDVYVIAQEAAWLAHVVADMLWPPHQVGHYKDFTIHYWFWKIHTDWYDGLTGALWDKNDKHSKIEFLTAFAFGGRKEKKGTLDYNLIDEAKKNYFVVENYLKSKAKAIKALHIYERFIEKGWSNEIKAEINQKLFPMMISYVATLWYLACLFKKEENLL